MVEKMKAKSKINKKLGFTLVELLISISIIAILSAVLVISYSNAQKNGRDQRRIADMKAIQSAAEQVYLLSGTYPTTVNAYNNTNANWTVRGQVVLQKIPNDPKGVGVTYQAVITTPAGSNYCVCAAMEKPKNGNAQDAGCSFTGNCGSLSSCYFCVKNQQ